MRRWGRTAARLHDAVTGAVVLLVVVDPLAARRRSAGWTAWFLSQRRLDRVMRRVAPPLFLSSIGAGAVAAVLAAAAGERRAAVGRAGAAAMTVAAVRVTLAVNDPVNQELRRWQVDDEPARWRARRERWEHGHRVRRVLLAMAALAAAAAR